MNTRNFLIPLAAAVAAPSLAFAGDEGDIGLRIVDGAIQTTVVGDDNGTGNEFDGPTERVFIADFGEFEDGDPDIFADPFPGTSETDDFVTNIPGFDSQPLTFLPGANVGIDIQTDSPLFGDNLTRFDGTDAIATGVELQASFGNMFRRTNGPDGSPLFLPAFTGSTDPDSEQDAGRWHRHYSFALFGGVDNTNGNLVAPGDGVYLLEFEIATEQPGIDTSDSGFIVFGVGSTEAEVDEAVEFLEATIPEPTSAAVLAIGGLVMLRRRR